MTTFRESLPTELVNHVTAICGPSGEAWLEELPQMLAMLEADWGLSVGDPFPGIEFNYVAPALRGEEPVALKIAPPYKSTEIFSEAEFLRSLNGAGAVRLLAVDRPRYAILVERAEPGVALFKQFEDDPEASVRPAVEVLERILREPPALRRDVGSLDAWFENFRSGLSTGFPLRFADKALEIYERLSVQRDRTFYLHGDFHPGNIVTARRMPFLAIDPKGIVGHLGYDIAVFLNNLHWWRIADTSVGELIDYAVREFASAFHIPEREIREWAFAYMVIGAWWNFTDMPDQYDTDLAKMDIWEV